MMDGGALTPVPAWRLLLLRGMYALVVVGLGCVVWPQFFHRTRPWPLMTGIESCMLVAFSLLALLGLRYPLQMLPVLLWELLWKTVWLVAIAAPSWAAGQMDDRTLGAVADCSAVVLLWLVIPWRHVVERYVRQRGERWRQAQDDGAALVSTQPPPRAR